MDMHSSVLRATEGGITFVAAKETLLMMADLIPKYSIL